MAVEQVAGCAWNARPDKRGLGGRMAWNPQFCRLIETLDALLELHEGDLGGTLRWLTTPNVVLSNEAPVELLVTEFGKRAVRQAIRAIEYGLPV